MIEVQADGTGALAVRSDDGTDVLVQADGFVRLSPAVLGELVRMAVRQPDAVPQLDARDILAGRPRSTAPASITATVPVP